MKFFKPEDFNKDRCYHSSEGCADIANAKLEREGKVVYFEMQHSWIEHYPVDKFGNNSNITKKALLINIEPIEKCKHPREKVSTDTCLYSGKPYQYVKEPAVFQCECGAKVQASAFEEIK